MTASRLPARRRAGALAASSALVWAGLAAGTGPASADTRPTSPGPLSPVTVSADPLPTVQVDGVVWSQVVVGTTVYVGGRFTSARPAGAAPGTATVPRANLLAFDIRTGELVPGFAPAVNAQVLVVTASPDGSRLYVGGDFTTANGVARSRIAAFDTATGSLVTAFAPKPSWQVRAIAATQSTVYVGGGFAAVGSVPRSRLAAVRAADGGLLPWAPVPGTGSTAGNEDGSTATSSDVLGLVVTGGGSQVVAAGRFDTLNGVRSTGIGALDPVTGATRPFALGQVLSNQGANAAVFSLQTDGTTVYGTGYDFKGPGNLEGAFAAAADGGTVRWVADCRGDSYSGVPLGGAYYLATHAHACHNIGAYPESTPRLEQRGLALTLAPSGTVGPSTLNNPDLQGLPAPKVLPWFPELTPGTFTGQNQAAWSATGTSQYLVLGGEFTRAGGKGQQGLVRYALPSLAPNRVGPAAFSPAAPIAQAAGGGDVRVAWTPTSDRDNENLTYRVFRDGGTTPVHTVTQASTFWKRPALAFTDTGATAGATATYRVRADDPYGNAVWSETASVDVPVPGPLDGLLGPLELLDLEGLLGGLTAAPAA